MKRRQFLKNVMGAMAGAVAAASGVALAEPELDSGWGHWAVTWQPGEQRPVAWFIGQVHNLVAFDRALTPDEVRLLSMGKLVIVTNDPRTISGWAKH